MTTSNWIAHTHADNVHHANEKCCVGVPTVHCSFSEHCVRAHAICKRDKKSCTTDAVVTKWTMACASAIYTKRSQLKWCLDINLIWISFRPLPVPSPLPSPFGQWFCRHFLFRSSEKLVSLPCAVRRRPFWYNISCGNSFLLPSSSSNCNFTLADCSNTPILFEWLDSEFSVCDAVACTDIHTRTTLGRGNVWKCGAH